MAIESSVPFIQNKHYPNKNLPEEEKRSKRTKLYDSRIYFELYIIRHFVIFFFFLIVLNMLMHTHEDFQVILTVYAGYPGAFIQC